MNQGNRNCMIIEHQDEYVGFLCSLNECKGPRWLCPTCLIEETHRHGRNNNGHIKNKKQILQQYEEKLKELENNQKQQKGKVLNIIKRINQQLQDFMKMAMDLQDELKNLVRDSENGSLNQELQNLYSKIKDNFFNLNNDEINKILGFNSYEIEKNININYINYILDQFPQIINNLSGSFMELEQSYSKDNYIIKNYKLKTLEQKTKTKIQNKEIFTFVQISSNEQYIAIADNLGSLVLKNLADNTEIAKTRLEKCIFQCEFSEDLLNLFVACKGGQLYKLNLELQIVNSFKTNQEVIQSLEIISDSILLSSSSRKIVKLDISNQRQLLKICTGSVNVKYDRVHDMIVGEFYNVIYFWNKTGQNVICKENAHELRIIQIQLIQKSQQLLSLDEEGFLKMWLINLNTKDLLKLKDFQDFNNRIMSFYSILNDMQIILYQEQGVYIINQKMQQQKELHKFTRILNYGNNLNIKQSKSVNYIPILSEDYQIHVLKVSE